MRIFENAWIKFCIDASVVHPIVIIPLLIIFGLSESQLHSRMSALDQYIFGKYFCTIGQTTSDDAFISTSVVLRATSLFWPVSKIIINRQKITLAKQTKGMEMEFSVYKRVEKPAYTSWC